MNCRPTWPPGPAHTTQYGALANAVYMPSTRAVNTAESASRCRDGGCAGAGNQLRAATALVVAGLLQRLFLQDLNGMLDDMRRLQRSMARSRAPARPDAPSAHPLAAVPKRSINLTANPLGMPGARCGADAPLSRRRHDAGVLSCSCSSPLAGVSRHIGAYATHKQHSCATRDVHLTSHHSLAANRRVVRAQDDTHYVPKHASAAPCAHGIRRTCGNTVRYAIWHMCSQAL